MSRDGCSNHPVIAALGALASVVTIVAYFTQGSSRQPPVEYAGARSEEIISAVAEPQTFSETTGRQEDTVYLTIHNSLGPDQRDNSVTVKINNQTVTLKANQHTIFTLPRSGTYRYSLTGNAVFEHQGKPPHNHVGQGDGQIYIEKPMTADLGWDYSKGFAPFTISLRASGASSRPRSEPVGAARQFGEAYNPDAVEQSKKSGKVCAQVSDKDARRLPAALVTIRRPGLAEIEFQGGSCIDVLPGTYALSVKAPGFASINYSGVVVNAGRTTNLAFTLDSP